MKTINELLKLLKRYKNAAEKHESEKRIILGGFNSQCIDAKNIEEERLWAEFIAKRTTSLVNQLAFTEKFSAVDPVLALTDTEKRELDLFNLSEMIPEWFNTFKLRAHPLTTSEFDETIAKISKRVTREIDLNCQRTSLQNELKAYKKRREGWYLRDLFWNRKEEKLKAVDALIDAVGDENKNKIKREHISALFNGALGGIVSKYSDVLKPIVGEKVFSVDKGQSYFRCR